MYYVRSIPKEQYCHGKTDTTFENNHVYVQYNIRNVTHDKPHFENAAHESEQIMPENAKPGAQSAMKKEKKPGKAKDHY
jgi:hypothetical protein